MTQDQKSLQGIFISLYKYLTRGSKGRQTLFIGIQWQDKRQWAKTEIQEILFKLKKKLFPCEGSQTLEQVAQKGCEVSILGDTPNSTGHSPQQPALVHPTLSKGLCSQEAFKLT